MTGDNQPTASDNDQGYYVQIGDAAQTNTNLFYNEAGGTPTILSGTDRANVASNTGVPAIADNLGHSALFTVTRTNATTITLSLSIDGGTAVTGTTTNLRTQFDEIAFSDGFVAVPLNFEIDDVQVNASTVVPEPAGLGLLAAGAGLLLRRRRK